MTSPGEHTRARVQQAGLLCCILYTASDWVISVEMHNSIQPPGLMKMRLMHHQKQHQDTKHAIE